MNCNKNCNNELCGVGMEKTVQTEEPKVRAKLETILKLLTEAGNIAYDIDLNITGGRPEKGCNPSEKSNAMIDVLDTIIDSARNVMDHLRHTLDVL